MSYRPSILDDVFRNYGQAMTATRAMREASEAHSNWLKMIQPSAAYANWLNANQSVAAMQAQYSEFERLSAVTGTMAAEQTRIKIEDDRRRYLDMLKPLASFRNQFADFDLYESVKHARAYMATGNSLTQLAREASESASMLAAIRGATVTSVARLSASISAIQNESLAELTRPFVEMQKMREFSNPLASCLRTMSGIQDAFKSLHLPIIDTASAAAIAQLWGEDGVERQLRALGIHAEAYFPDNQVTLPTEADAQQFAATGHTAHPDPLALLGIILTVLIFFYQMCDSAQMETRLAGKIHAVGEMQEKQIAALTALLEELIKQDAHAVGTRFVVRDRLASVSIEPESGATVVATVFPNQVVHMIEERGKWIKVEYYDFISQSGRSGWALKKYFIRVPDTTDRR